MKISQIERYSLKGCVHYDQDSKEVDTVVDAVDAGLMESQRSPSLN